MLPNRVLIRVKRESHDSITVGESNLYLDTSFEVEKHIMTRGEVVDFGPLLYKRGHPDSLSDDVDMEIEKGDEVIFHYNTIIVALKNQAYMEVDGEKLFIVRYDRLFAAIRDGEVIPLNGNVFVEPEIKVYDEYLPGLFRPDITKEEISCTRGVVRYKGCLVRQYAMDVPADEDDVEVGDKVLFHRNDSIPLEYEMHRTLPFMYRMTRKDIIGIYE